MSDDLFNHLSSIEGIPLITRFKTTIALIESLTISCIEGIPLITRFKTKI